MLLDSGSDIVVNQSIYPNRTHAMSGQDLRYSLQSGDLSDCQIRYSIDTE